MRGREASGSSGLASDGEPAFLCRSRPALGIWCRFGASRGKAAQPCRRWRQGCAGECRNVGRDKQMCRLFPIVDAFHAGRDRGKYLVGNGAQSFGNFGHGLSVDIFPARRYSSTG